MTVPTLPGIGDAQASSALTATEKADLRFLCGYPLLGNSASGFVGYRFFEVQGQLEFRLANCAPAEAQAIRQMISEAQPLRLGILGAAANLDTDVAAVWTRNRSEVSDRKRLYNDWRLELCDFLGVAPGPGLTRQGGGSGRIVI